MATKSTDSPLCRPQIYKHNFARWGFQKNKKHSPPADPPCVAVTHQPRKQPSRDSPLSSSLTLAHQDNLVLALISHVRTWNSSFYEHHKDHLSPPSAPPAWLTAQNARNLVITFELVSDLLNKGHGDLAGRMARKAFLLAESILETDPPALLWNLLGLMHRMLTSSHLRLLWMLLTHMTCLVQEKYASSHPLSLTLRHLRGSIGSVINESSSLPVSSGETPSPSSSANSPGTTPDCHVLGIVEKVWLLNSEMLFDHLDIGLSQVYEHIKIDLCPFTPPAVSPDIVKRWAIQLKESRPLDATSPSQDTPAPCFDKLEALLLLPAAAAEDPLPDQYNLVQRQIGAVLRHVEDEILDGKFTFIGHAKLAIVVVAGLMMRQKLQETQFLPTDLGYEVSPASDKEYKHHALKLACIIRMILDSQASLAEVGCYIGWDTIAMNKCIVALYDYADANLDPQALQELSALEDALMEANQMDGARQVGMDRLQRLRQYVAEIPVGSA